MLCVSATYVVVRWLAGCLVVCSSCKFFHLLVVSPFSFRTKCFGEIPTEYTINRASNTGGV